MRTRPCGRRRRHAPHAARPTTPRCAAASGWPACSSTISRPVPAIAARTRPARARSGTTTIVEPSLPRRSSTRSAGSRRAARRSTAPGPREAAADRPVRRRTPPPRPRVPAGATTLGAEAARRTVLSGPAQRQATQRHSSTTSAGGPADTTECDATRRSASASGSTPSATTQPAHPTAVQADADDRADRDAGRGVGGQVVEHPPPRERRVRTRQTAPCGLAQARASAALRRPAAWSVCSHVKPGSLRPKWPYAAVRL